MRKHVLISTGLLVLAAFVGTKVFLKHRHRNEQRRADMAVSLEKARASMQAAFDRRTDFILQKYPTGAKKARWEKQLPSVRGLEFREQKDFQAYDRVQSQVGNDLAQEIVALHQSPRPPAHFEDWVKRLQEFDRESDTARATYVQTVREARLVGMQVPSFSAEDQIQ